MNEKISQLCSFILSKIPKNESKGTPNPLSTLAHCDESGYYPIHYLAAGGYVDYLRLYLEVISIIPGGNILIDIRDLNGCTALHHAVQHGQIEVARTLIQAGTSVNVQNFEGKTALYLSMKEDTDRNLIYDIVKALLYFGANPNIADENGVTPLHVACSIGVVPLVELLIDNGAWINVRDGDGDTPIFYAIREGKDVIVERLVRDFGVNIEDVNEDGETPLDFCKSIGDQDMEKLILSIYSVPPVNLPGKSGLRFGSFEPRKPTEENNFNGENVGMDIDLSYCSLSSSSGSRTKFSFTPDFSSSQTAF